MLRKTLHTDSEHYDKLGDISKRRLKRRNLTAMLELLIDEEEARQRRKQTKQGNAQ